MKEWPHCTTNCAFLSQGKPDFRFFTGNIESHLKQHPIVDAFDLSSIRTWGCGAAPLGNDLVDVVEKRTKTGVRGGYGMTETTCVISIAIRANSKQGCVGKLVPGMSAKLVEGELYVKGPNIMKGYLRNPKANSETFTDDGWMKTGDICHIDKDGDLFIIDRVKEVGLTAFTILA